MLINVAVTNAAVGAIAAFRLQTNLTATFAKQESRCFAAFANIGIVEAIAAVLTEVEPIVAVFYTDRRCLGAVGIVFTAIKAKLAILAYIHLTEGVAAIRTQMVVPIRVLDAVFTAAAALTLGIVQAAEYAQTAIIAQFNAVFIQAFLTLLTDDTAFFTVIVSKVTLCIRSVAVAALLAVHIFQFPASLAEAAAVAQTTHTVSTDPTVTAQFIF